ncbi:MAG: hypothetical protein E2O39_13845 [Planctomycetota bacterium]|nr:MAG: hypothetical protein E2O39_13845 [Planctomycetota bacterium]
MWLHGLGTLAAVLAGGLLFAFLADFLLHVPFAVRLVHVALLVALPIYFFRKELLHHLRRLPDRAGLAMLVERRHPEVHELLVSAVQLDPETADARSRPLIDRIVAEAEDYATGVKLNEVFDRRGPRLRLGLGAILAGLTTTVFLVNPALASIFFQRMILSGVAWPQRTHLTVEIPIIGERAQIEIVRAGEGESEHTSEIRVRVARGSDVPVLVRAKGVIPDEVVLHFSGGQTAVVTSGSMPLFRTLLPSVQEDIEFYVTGGDDERGKPVVKLIVLQPPDVAGLAIRVDPPAYSGLESVVLFDTDVEVLAGSRLVVHVLPDPSNATGVVRLLPEDRELPLLPAEFPRRQPEEEPRGGLAFEFVATQSLRYWFELVDESGLPNPDPGLYGVQVIEDRRPDVLLLSPGRAEIDVVPGGAVALRIRVEDDFGVASIDWEVRSADDDTLLSGAALDAQVITPVEAKYGADDRTVLVGRTRLEVDELGGGAPLYEGQRMILQVRSRDNREPNANESLSVPVRMRVISGDLFLRRLQDRLARAGEQAGRLNRLQAETLRRTREVLAGLQSDDLQGEAFEVATLVTGQRRVQGDARALARDLAAITESLLYARVDNRARPLFEALDEALAGFTDRSFHPEPWRELSAQYTANRLGSAGLAGQLIDIVGLSLEISEVHTLEAADALVQAQESSGPASMQTEVARAYELESEASSSIDRLLEQLAGWDNYQSILTQLRDALNGQKNLMERTRQFAQDH